MSAKTAKPSAALIAQGALELPPIMVIPEPPALPPEPVRDPTVELTEAFRRKESVRVGMVRLVRILTRDALRHIEHPENLDRTEDIHQVRVQCKRLRALMRLFKPVAEKQVLKQENERLRDASRALSDFRDAFVAGETLKRVFEDTAPRRVQDAAVMLGVSNSGLKRMRSLDASFRSAAKDFREMLAALRQLTLSTRGWEAVAPGLERSYRRAQESFQKCRKHRSEHLAECFHDWRKRVKDLAYQLEFLENVEPTVVRFWRKEFRKLGTMLGEDHDYVVFAHQVRERERHYEHLATFHPVRKRLRKRLKELREKEFALAGPLLAEPPEMWIARMAGLWLRWKNPSLAIVEAQPEKPAEVAPTAVEAKPGVTPEKATPEEKVLKTKAKPKGKAARQVRPSRAGRR